MEKKGESKKEGTSNSVTWKELWFFPVVLLIFFGSWWYLSTFHPNTQERGTFGDQFGIVNALFSGLAFAGLLYTIILQRKDLNLQYKELEDNRNELKRQTEEFKAQNENLRIQRFEDTFFNMLSLQQQIVNDLSINHVKKVKTQSTTETSESPFVIGEVPFDERIQGRSLFYHAFEVEEHKMFQGDKTIKVKGLANVMIKNGFNAYHTYYTASYFDHYFRHFYAILKFIKRNEWLGREKQYEYASMLRATLSRYELVWLYYNGLSVYGKDKLKPLIEEFTMLKNLRIELLTICKENSEIAIELGLSHDDVTSAGFSGTDFEFWLTEECEDKKYHIMAFYNKDHIEEGKANIKKWHDYLQSHSA